VVAVQEAQLASNPVCVFAVVESAGVPEPVMHEAQTEFVASQAYPVKQAVQVKPLERETVHVPQLETIPVYVSDVPVFAPVAQLTQALYSVSQTYPVAQAEQAKTVPSVNILASGASPAVGIVHVSQLATNPVYVIPAVFTPVAQLTQSLLSALKIYPAEQEPQVTVVAVWTSQSLHEAINPVYVTVPEFTPVAQLRQIPSPAK
jgi:hypothetical protein